MEQKYEVSTIKGFNLIVNSLLMNVVFIKLTGKPNAFPILNFTYKIRK